MHVLHQSNTASLLARTYPVVPVARGNSLKIIKLFDMAMQALEQVKANIKVQKDRRKDEVAVIETFVKGRLVEEMKLDSELFDALFREVYHVGSSYDRLRIGDTGDFDLNLVLDIDILASVLNLNYGGVRPGFVNLEVDWNRRRIPSNHPLSGVQDDLKHLLLEPRYDGKFIFNAGKANRWMEGLVQRGLNGISVEERRIDFNIRQLTMQKKGPAKTLCITMNSGLEVEVDLVPAFDFPMRQLDRHPRIGPKVASVAPSSPWPWDRFFSRFCVVPKSSSAWKISLALFEKKHVKGDQKTLIRILKAFRDTNPPLNSHLSSYSLKTVVMHLHDDIGESSPLWQSNQLPELFLLALEKLADYIDPDNSRGIPSYWDSLDNEIYGMNERERLNKFNWLNRTISCLRQHRYDRECWLEQFQMGPQDKTDDQVDPDEKEREEDSPLAAGLMVAGLGMALIGTIMEMRK